MKGQWLLVKVLLTQHMFTWSGLGSPHHLSAPPMRSPKAVVPA